MGKRYHKIGTAYDAFWFLYNHPKYMLRERCEVTEDEAEALKKRGFIVTKDKGGKLWREFRHLHRHAIETNLSIHYAKVDAKGKVNDNPVFNVLPECWLEFGEQEYDYCTPWDNETSRLEFHDLDLDCGGRTFDGALIALAKKVRKLHGDYAEKKGREGPCGRPCGDCAETRKMREQIRAETKNLGGCAMREQYGSAAWRSA